MTPFERPDASRLKNLASGASASMRGNDVETMTFGPPAGRPGGGFGNWGKGSSGSRYVIPYLGPSFFGNFGVKLLHKCSVQGVPSGLRSGLR